MAIKVIFLDLDGTTLNEQGKLSAVTRQAMEAAMAAGVEVVVASGRSLSSLPKDVMAVPGIRYAITSNGAAVHSVSTGACLRQYHLNAAAVEQVLAIVAGEEAVLEVFVGGQAYADAAYAADPARFGAPERAIEYVRTTRVPEEDIVAFIRAHIDELESMDIIAWKAEPKARIWERVRNEVPGIYITSSIPRLLELSDRRCGKHNGMAFICEKLGIDAAECAAFGDADNDMEMLRAAGIGYAMAGATPACLAAADRVTRSNAEDGVAKGIYELLSEK